MDNVISLIASAIASGEGFFVNGALPARDNNPGDLRAAPWLVHPVVANGFWVAANAAQGTAGLYHQIALDILYAADVFFDLADPNIMTFFTFL